MRSVPKVAVVAAAVLLACCGGVAQRLVDEIARAAGSAEELEALRLRERPLREVVDAVALLHEVVDEEGWGRMLAPVVARAGELERLWRDEPTRRRGRAPVFAAVLGGWSARYGRSDAGTRDDVEAVARFVDPVRFPDLDDVVDDARFEAVTRLQRIAMRGNDERAAGRRRPTLQAHLAGGRRARLEAVAALRRRLGLPASATLFEQARGDERLLASLTPRSRATRQVRAAMAAGRHGDVMQRTPDIELDDEADRRWLAGVFVDLVFAEGPPDETDAEWRDAAADVFAAASRAGGEGRELVLTAAEDLGDELRVLALRALVFDRPYGSVTLATQKDETLRRVAELVRRPLRSADDQVVAEAAHVGAAVLAGTDAPELRAWFERAARAIMPGRVAAMTTGPIRFRWCGTRAWRRALPHGRDASLVWASCMGGDTRLLDPVVDQLGAGRREHAEFLLRCIEALAPHLDDAQAERAFEAVREVLDRGVIEAIERDAHAAMLSLLPSLPDSFVVDYAPFDREMRHGTRYRRSQIAALAEHRAEALVGSAPDDFDLATRRAPELFLAAPAMLRRAYEAGPHERRRQYGWFSALGGMWLFDADALAALVADGALPPACLAEAVESACRDEWRVGHVSLEAMADTLSLAPRGALAHSPIDVQLHRDVHLRPDSWGMQRRIASIVLAEPAVLRRLTKAEPWTVAFAAVRRLATMGTVERQVAREALDELATRLDPEHLPDLVRLALETRVWFASLPAALDRLRWHEGYAALVASTTELWPRPPVETGRRLRLPGVDAAAGELRLALPVTTAERARDLAGMLVGRSPTTTAAALELVRELPPRYLPQREVALATTHADASVRRAAYRALTILDVDLWPSALLLHEAAFDRDPSVRAVARAASASGVLRRPEASRR